MNSELNKEAIDLLIEDYKLGIYTEEEYIALLSDFGLEKDFDEANDFQYNENNNSLEIYRHIDVIKKNIKPIAKMIFENKWGQKNVDESKIVVVNGNLNKAYSIFSITFINNFGRFIKVDLKDIAAYLEKIDFDE
jgi:hypothetical protein